MSYFNIVAATTENTVVTEYIPEPRTDEAFSTHKFVVCIGVQLLFAAAFLACAIAAKRRKRVLEQ